MSFQNCVYNFSFCKQFRKTVRATTKKGTAFFFFFTRWRLQIEQNILWKFVGSTCLKYYKPFLSISTIVWWKTVYLKKKSNLVCWICNGPCFWSQCSICVCKRDKYKTEKFLSKLSDLKHEEEDRVNVYFVILPGLLRLLPSTSALICEYLLCTPN